MAEFRDEAQRSQRVGITKEPPGADACMRIDSPKPYRQRENGWLLVLN
jgi:hypothetical protein